MNHSDRATQVIHAPRASRPAALALAFATLAAAIPGRAQPTPPRQQELVGSIRCEIEVLAPGYCDQQTQTWTLAGTAPATPGAMKIHAATWSVSGQGWLQKTTGERTFASHWTRKVDGLKSPITVFIRASDNQRIIKQQNVPLTVKSSVTGSQDVLVDHVVQSTSKLCFDTTEFSLPWIESDPESTQVGGTSSSDSTEKFGPLQPKDATVTINIAWEFGKGSARPLPPPTMIVKPAPPLDGSDPQTSPAAGGGAGGGAEPASDPTDPAKAPAPATSNNRREKFDHPSGILNPPAAPSREKLPHGPTKIRVPDAPAGPTSAEYLVTVTQLHCGAPTADDQASFDGMGDEIYAAAFVRRYDRQTGDCLEQTNLETDTYGDTRGAGNTRVQAGSLSTLGGIREGDTIPGHGTVDRSVNAQRDLFLWQLWRGTLTDGVDALVISPAIFESDDANAALVGWVQRQNELTDSLFLDQRLHDQIDKKVFAPLRLDATEGLSNVLAQRYKRPVVDILFTAFGLPGLASISSKGDRPIGLVANGPDDAALPNTTIILTREIIEKALAAPFTPAYINQQPAFSIIIPKPGIMVMVFKDETQVDAWLPTKACYAMVLQVENLSAPPAPAANAGSNSSGTSTIPEMPKAPRFPEIPQVPAAPTDAKGKSHRDPATHPLPELTVPVAPSKVPSIPDVKRLRDQPAITAVDPNSAPQGMENLVVNFTAQGSHFEKGKTTIDLGVGITELQLPLVVTSPTQARGVFNVDAAAAPGKRTITITTGAEVITLAEGFTITEAVDDSSSVGPKPDQYEPNDGPDTAPQIASGFAGCNAALRFINPAIDMPLKTSISANFDKASDTSDWFTAVCREGSTGTIRLELTAFITEGPSDGRYRIKIYEKTSQGVEYRAGLLDPSGSTAVYEWNASLSDDSKILLIEVHHVSGAPSNVMYKLNLQFGD